MNVEAENQPDYPLTGEELQHLEQALRSGQLAGGGPYTERCHQMLSGLVGSADVLLTTSCTTALEMSAVLCDIQPGDEVIVPSYTFVSSALAFVMRGAVPVFVDIREQDLCLEPSLLEAAITEKTRAVVVVHYAGLVADMSATMAVCNRHGIHLIEDAAQALYSHYKGAAAGSLGRFGAISFHQTKNLGAGEGGALLINDPADVERAHIVWEKGTNRQQFLRGEKDKYTWLDLGSSYLPSELTAAMLYTQLVHGTQIVARRAQKWMKYYANLLPMAVEGHFRIPSLHEDREHNGHIFWLLAQDQLHRDRLIAALRDQGIPAMTHYVPLHSSPAGQRYGRVGSTMAVTDSVYSRLLRLPVGEAASDAMVERAIQIIHDQISV